MVGILYSWSSSLCREVKNRASTTYLLDGWLEYVDIFVFNIRKSSRDARLVIMYRCPPKQINRIHMILTRFVFFANFWILWGSCCGAPQKTTPPKRKVGSLTDTGCQPMGCCLWTSMTTHVELLQLGLPVVGEPTVVCVFCLGGEKTPDFSFLSHTVILLMDEILHHLGSIKPCS